MKIKEIQFKNKNKEDLLVEAIKAIKGNPLDELGNPTYTDEQLVENCIKNYLKDIVKAFKMAEKEKQAREAIIDVDIF